MALITPAKSHPEVVVQAVSARDRARAEEFAKKHGIPDVRDTYQGESGRLLLDFIIHPIETDCVGGRDP